jgi:glutathione S-transferase
MGTEVEYVDYVPSLSEPWLRWRLRRPIGRLTVPVLLHDGEPLTDSLQIVYWASDRASDPLAPPDLREAIESWNDRASAALEAGRLLTTHRVLADPTALQASLPFPLRHLGGVGRVAGRFAARQLVRKYPDGATSTDRLQVIRTFCEALRTALNGGEHVLDGPSYADLTAAVGLSFVQPDPGAPIAPEARACWTQADLVEAFPDLLAWRDRLLDVP